MDLTTMGMAVLLALLCLPRRGRRLLGKALTAMTVWSAKRGLRLSILAAKHTFSLIRGHRLRSLRATKEERRILGRLQPSYWRKHAEAVGLDGTLTGRAQLTLSGITVAVRIKGTTWTPKKLKDAEGQIRNLIGCRSDLRIEITNGGRGGWAKMVFRTRLAVPDGVLAWDLATPEFGIDTVTGEVVDPAIDDRILIAGMSGAGKSVASRPLMYKASEGDNKLVIIDLKKVEGRLWDHRARVASTPETVLSLVGELVAEMHERTDLMPKGQATWAPTKQRPRIIVVVDEGAEVRSSVKEALVDLESLARMARAAEIHLWWMTQKPTMSGPDAGIPPQIAAQIARRISLAVSTPTEARTVLGEDAQDKGWMAHELPYPGYAYVRSPGKGRPHPVKVRFMTDKQVIGLDDRTPWQRPVSLTKAATQPSESLPKSRVLSVPKSPKDAVLEALSGSDCPIPGTELIELSGVPRSSGYNLLRSMVDAGDIIRQSHGLYVLADD